MKLLIGTPPFRPPARKLAAEHDAPAPWNPPHCTSDIRSRITDLATSALERMENPTKWFIATEFELVQYRWPRGIVKIDELLEKVSAVIDPTKEDRAMSKPQNDPLVPWEHLFIPILKLSRLFFKKLSNLGMNMNTLAPFTEMRSDQLEYLVELAERVAQKIKYFYAVVVPSDNDTGSPDSQEIISAARDLEEHFQPAVLCILLYFLPLIPDTDHLPVQSHLRAWFITWSTHFHWAMGPFLHLYA
ncbi:hypothetical protein PTTG_26571 [Puccinia triticina 1-1 BBBD Race 1]|uniref:Uncharacterized protein n=2 Tax=Puccinia triticina TaxID=208348 RepID=A0A180GSF6_PUCT1|nr:hypothetical protein PTTG_26571 [Puccinia triticina 1-1 BBBD Race 1]WAR62126.1 hypothetical protein PtB15_14B220 [Puccinia triticina]